MELIDTVGLNEAQEGKITAKDAALALLKFLKGNRKGFSLLVMVIGMGRILRTDGENYKLFYEVHVHVI